MVGCRIWQKLKVNGYIWEGYELRGLCWDQIAGYQVLKLSEYFNDCGKTQTK
jgi:hypothetical protein